MADESISSEMPNPEETSPMVDSDAPVDQGSERPQEAFSTPVDPAERAAEDTILKAKTIKETKTLGPVRVFGEGGVISEQGAGRVQVFDFGASSFLTQRELRQMRQLLEGFVDDLAARLSLFLRIEIDLILSQVEASTVREALSRMDNSTHLTLLRMAPLRGHTVVETPLNISLAMVDRLLGGGAKSSATPSRLNEVEISLMDDVTTIIGSEWANMWKDFKDIQSSIVSHETSPQYLSAFSLDAAALDMAIDTKLGETEATLRMVIPRMTLEPLIGTLREIKLDSQSADTASPTTGPIWDDRFDGIKTEAHAWCRGPSITLKEISDLQIGQTLSFHPSAFNEATLRVAGRDAFRGSIGKINDQWAFKVESKNNEDM
jgi:flagellar motor switch protein FliM